MDPRLITNTKKVEKAADKYTGKALTDSITNGFFTVDNRWNVKYWNQAAEQLLGVKASAILGKNLWEEFAAVIPVEFYTVYQKAFLKSIPLHFEEYWGEMGSWFDVITYYCDDTLSISFKSSNYPHAEHPEMPIQRLKTLTELYKFITQITNDCLWEWDLRSAEIFWIDGGHKRVFGYQIENALIPQSFWENSIHAADRGRVLTGLKAIMATGIENLWEDYYRFAKSDGTFAYVHDRGHIIYEGGKATRIIGATQDISHQVVVQKKMELQLVTSQRELTDAIITAQENERNLVGQELHENLNQILAVTKIYIDLARKHNDKKDFYLEKSSAYVSDVMEIIRKISKVLIPTRMEHVGLNDSIKILLDDFRMILPAVIEFHEDGVNIEELDEKLQLNIFRILQEQLNNVLKHSKATHVEIKLSGNQNEVFLFIADNGEGSDLTHKPNGGGIRNIISRAGLFHGKVTMISRPGNGFSLNVFFPLNYVEPVDDYFN